MSISTSLPQLEPTSRPVYPLRRPARRRRFGRRGWIAIGLVVLVLVAAAGGVLAYLNTLPTTLSTNIASGQKDVPTDGSFQMTFSRSVPIKDLQAAFSILPSVSGSIGALSGDTRYAWTPAAPLDELTRYTITLLPIYDAGSHRFGGGRWSFTTIIVPRVTSIAAPDGTQLKDGMELDPSSSLKLAFNDAMETSSIKATAGAQELKLTWAADGRSATFSTAGIPSGPLTIQLAPGGRDQTGHAMAAAFTLKTGVYWHDHEHTISLRYPAIIQIPNDSFARDQNGLQAAGVVFEYLAEGGITRLSAIYQNVPGVVGPMRSARFISLKIARHYRGLLFQSGESQATRARAAQDPTPQFFDVIGYQYRTAARYAPDNLMIKGDRVLAAQSNYFGRLGSFTVPKARPDMGAGGTGGAAVTVDEHYSTYRYDAVTGTYAKTEQGHAYSDASLHQPLRIEMVIVLHTTERLLDVGDGHGAHIHDFDLDTSGAVQIFYKGLGYPGTWRSTDSHGPLSFTLADGRPVTLPPGLVWIDVTR